MRAPVTLLALAFAVATNASAQEPRPRGPSAGPRPLLFGFALDCTRCTMTPGVGNPAPVWHYTELPRVAAVRPGGAAATAGVQEGDTIVLVDSLSILSPEGARRFSAARPGGRMRLTLRRAGRTVNVQLALGRLPDPPPPLPTPTPQQRRYSGDLGDAAVDVWSDVPVTVTVDSLGALVIQTGGSTVRIARKAPPGSPTRPTYRSIRPLEQ
jgi:membrane-associated protease RseP (regulator of RpoE activity)